MSASDRLISALPGGRSSTITVRASSWASLFDCGYRWEGEHILKIRKPSGLRAQLGTAIHAGTAAFDTARITGADVSVDDAAGVFVDTLRNPDRDVDYSQDDLTLRDAERLGLALHVRYCADVSPMFDFISVEQTLAPMHIDCGGGVIVSLTGSMDRARVATTPGGGVVIPDLKSGRAVISGGAVVTKGRAPQIGTYQLLYEHTAGEHTEGGQIVALSTGSRPDVRVSGVWDAKRVMLGTDTAPGLIEIAAGMFRSGLFPPNPTSPLCSPRYCARWATCPYHE